MKAWNHLNFEQRKIIVHLLAKRSKLCVIADTLEVDPSAVSKEIKRNRVLVKPGRVADQGCKHLGRFPYCCNGCVKKYQGCLHNHYTYDAQKAQGLAQRRLVDTRSGINMTPQEYKQLDATIKEGVDDGHSVYHIVHSHPELTLEVNFKGTKNLVDAISESGHGFLMFASSISVYGDRVDDYQISLSDTIKFSQDDYYAHVKKMTEDMIIASGIEYTIFRLTAIMDKPRIDPLMFHMPLETKIEIASGRDTARAFVLGLEKKEQVQGRIFNLGGGESCRCSYRELLKGCFDIYGLNYKHLDEKGFANHNFHCGYYKDGDELNDILGFRSDSLESYYKYLREHVSSTQKTLTKVFSYFILSRLNAQSEPRLALRSQNEDLIRKYFR